MERLKKFLHVMILPCLVAMMFGLFTVQASAAKINCHLNDISVNQLSGNLASWKDGTVVEMMLSVSEGYRLPDKLDIYSDSENRVLGEADYSYDSKTGKLKIYADSVKGNITINGTAVKLIRVEDVSFTSGCTFVVGTDLRVEVKPANATVTYRWKRDGVIITDKNGDPIATPTYTLAQEDIDCIITVEVTGNGDYYDSVVSHSVEKTKKKQQEPPTKTAVSINHVTKNGGNDGSINAADPYGKTLLYYNKINEAWEPLPAKNMTAGEYQICYKATADSYDSPYIWVTILEPCVSPVATDVTKTDLTEAGASTGKLESNSTKPMEYSLDDDKWYDFPASGLKAGKYYVRFAATTAYKASASYVIYVQEPTKLTISPADITITHVNVKGAATGGLKAASSYAATIEVQVDGIWKTLPQKTMKAGTYQVRYAETDTTFPSASCSVTIKEPADAPIGIRISDVSVHGGNDGAITSLQTSWQVSYDGKTWNDCTGTSLTGLSAGEYYFRTKETATHLPSEAVKQAVRQPEATPEAMIDFVNGTLKNLVAKAEYLIDNVVYKAESNGTISILDNNLSGRSIVLKKKGNETTTLDSAKQTVEIPSRPANPEAPTIVKKTDTTVEIKVVEGLEYSINDGKTWFTSTEATYVFEKLRSNTSYTIYARVKAVEGKSFCSASVGTTFTTKKSSAYAVDPTKAAAVTITDTTITVQVVSGQEYRLGSEEWRTSVDSTITWDNLKENTRYTIQTRTAETADTMPSSAVSSYITTFTKHTLGEIKIDFFQKAIVELPAGIYSINGGQAVEIQQGDILDVENYFGREIQLRRLGSVETKTVDSDPKTVKVISPIAAPDAEQVKIASIRSTLTGFIVVGPDPSLEYQILDVDQMPLSAWKSSGGEDIVFDGLQHSTEYWIQICFKQTETDPKSNAYIGGPLYTMFYEETPAVAVNPASGVLNGLIPGASYLINGEKYSADEKGTVPVAETWIGSEISVVKCGDELQTVNSLPQVIMLPGRVAEPLSPIAYFVTYYDLSNGAIGNVNSEMEYSADGGLTWIAITGEKIENLPVAVYYVRYRAQGSELFAGEAKEVEIELSVALAEYKDVVIAQLEEIYDKLEASRQYNDAQLTQIRAILDAGIENIKHDMSSVADVNNAKATVAENIEQVPCANIATADGKLVGEDITSDTLLQYPNDGDEIWGNVSNEDGLDPDLSFTIQMLGKSDTELLRERFFYAFEHDGILSADPAIAADDLKAMLQNMNVVLGMEITLNQDAIPTEQFKGTYRVTILLPIELQGRDSLNVISVGADGTISYHPATVVGKYLTFETTHFSIYGVIGKDTLAIAKADTLQKISELSEKLDPDVYSRDNWEKLQNTFTSAIYKVTDAKTEQEVSDAWMELLMALDQIETKKSLGWLWLVVLLIVLIVALVIVCYLVWQVHYYDGEEQLHKRFHFWGTRVMLWTPEKEEFVLEGWYYDPELTDRVEDDFKMPWHSVKLFAKWNAIEILTMPEEEPVEKKTVEETVEDVTDEALAVSDADNEESAYEAEEEYLSEAEEDVSEDDIQDLALLDGADEVLAEEEEVAESTENSLPLAQLEAAETENRMILEAPEENVEEDAAEGHVDEASELSKDDASLLEVPASTLPELPEAQPQETGLVPVADEALIDAADVSALPPADEADTALLNAPENGIALLNASDEPEQALLNAPEETEQALLEAPAEGGVALLTAPEENTSKAIVVVGEAIPESTEDEENLAEDDSYKSSESYQAWLRFAEEEETAVAEVEDDEKLEDGDEVQLFVNEKTGEKYHIRFNISFRAKMTSLSDEAKGFYRELKDEFLTYKGVKTRISWKAETVRKGRETIAKFAIRDHVLCVFLALDPDAYRDSKYVFESVKDVKAYEAVPMLIRIKSDLSCRKVKELIAAMMEPREVKRLNAAPETDYSYLDEDSSTEARLRAGQLRIWAEGPDDQVCANRAAAATLHYLISPEATAEEAEALITDEMLTALMPPRTDILIVPDHVGEVSLEQLCKKFYVGDTVDVAAMKEKELVAPDVNYVKITAEGDMTKRLTVSAHMFEKTAAKMILLTGGDVEVMTE